MARSARALQSECGHAVGFIQIVGREVSVTGGRGSPVHIHEAKL